MSTSSNVNTINGVSSYEQYTQKSLYATPDAKSLGQDTFLKLLTTQLQHQDPLNPMDNSEFVAQLSQFSSLEQLTNANDNLQGLAVGMSSVGNATMVNLIGKEVRAVGDGFKKDSNSETLHFDLGSAAENVTLSIYDADGNVVLQKGLGSLDEGEASFTWDGKSSSGVPLGNGNYTFAVTATNGSSSVDVTTYTQGLVDQIDFTTGVARPRIDGQNVSVDKIVQIFNGE